MTATATLGSRPADAFSHEAFFYDGRAEFVRGTSQFIREGLERDESVLVAVAADKIADLRSELGRPAALRFVDMAQLGRNPARIIPAWRTFLDANLAAGRRVRGIGEPIWPDREPAELVESQHHEALLNLAFGGSPHWRLLCPYDVGALRADVIEEAYRSHPVVIAGGPPGPSEGYLPGAARLLAATLGEPAGEPDRLRFGAADLPRVRRLVVRWAGAVGLRREATEDLVLTVHELATNSLRHGGGAGTLRVWTEGGALVCELADPGLIEDPLAGRVQPALDGLGGRGLWLANQLCDLVQIRSGTAGTVVRVHVRLDR